MKNKKLLSLLMAAAMVTTVGLAAGCNNGDPKPNGDDEGGDSQATKLASPVVTISGNVLSWNAVEHADAYDVYEGTTIVSDDQTSCSYSIAKTEPGSYEYYVVATSSSEDYTDSDKSVKVTYTINPQSAVDTSTKLSGKVYVVGDSTVCEFDDKYYVPRYGYGTQLYNYLNCDASQIVNIAASGRSSYSFMVDNKSDYDNFVNNISAGDYLIIGFGHNDEKREVKRYADPTLSSSDTSTMIGSYNTERAVSFKYLLKHYYIDVAKAAGATPILCTPITRLYEDSKKSSYDTGHTTATQSATDTTVTPNVTTTWNGGDYAQAIRDLAEEQDVLCIDLNATTIADYKALGYDEASKYHAATGAKWADAEKTIMEITGLDATHTNLYGAKMNAYYIASALKTSSLPINANVRTNITKPTYDENASAIFNSSYTIPNREPFNPATDAAKLEHWGVTGTTADSNSEAVYNWYGTAFVGSSALSNFVITQGTDEDGGLTFTLKETTSKGKIESGGDSLVAVFIQVPFTTAFTVTAKAEVKSFGGNQAGFGLMVRDDMYLDYDSAVSSNYVTAGGYGTSTGVPMGFARNNGSLVAGTRIDIAAGDKFDLSIARLSQSITANTGSYSYSAVSDFDLAVSDSEYVYVCLWVTRGTEVTFSNITFASTEWVQA